MSQESLLQGLPLGSVRGALRSVLLVLLLGGACAGPRDDAKAGGRASPASDAAPADGLAPALRIAMLSDLEGVLEPCGCTRDSLGGMDRLAHVLDEVRREPGPLLVLAAGSLLVPADRHDAARARPALAVQTRLTAEAMAALLAQLRVDVVAPSPSDIAHAELPLENLMRTGGVELLGQATRDRLAGFKPFIARTVGPRRVVLLLDGGAEPRANLVAPGDLLVAIADSARPKLSHSAGSPRVDLVIQTGGGRYSADISVRDGVLNVAASQQARELLVLSLWPNGAQAAPWRLTQERPRAAARANLALVEHHPLGAQVPPDEGVRRFLDQFFLRIKALHQRDEDASVPEPRAGERGYVGSRTCAACHTEAYYWWLSTPHARAFQTLEKRGRELDLDCIGCHVTGFDQPGGARIGRLSELRGVGCESCHGPGAEHVNNPRPPQRGLARSVPEARCVACHDAQHSDDFSYQEKQAQLRVKAHGMPRGSARVRQPEGARADP
jgi:Cytochrome c554 and c-prime